MNLHFFAPLCGSGPSLEVVVVVILRGTIKGILLPLPPDHALLRATDQSNAGVHRTVKGRAVRMVNAPPPVTLPVLPPLAHGTKATGRQPELLSPDSEGVPVR